ncbi:hypothetical protein BDA99DRAFT_607278 [Phascolomyces articulosus]|uniref:WW domain-containing protein n=1 Tax=Phascolomyces articulosus TaxID=60185 RepID=A0AAD5JUP4_9FUNG|nr:hypothetical protein BDA99DRAFT_607278 [Phascolomyces articulosus]
MSSKESSNAFSISRPDLSTKSKSSSRIITTPQEGEISGSEKQPIDPSESDVDQSTTQTKNTTKAMKEKDEENDKTETSNEQVWTPAWDSNNQAYYWWNTATFETTWIDPYAKQDDDDNKVPHEDDASSYDNRNYLSEQQYPSYPSEDHSYTFQAHFNTRSGKFQAASDLDRLNPERLSIESRATRQMKYYFDVDTYTEQRNKQYSLGVSQGSKQRLSKKELEKYKKAKLEKKVKRARDWLRD